MSTFLGAFTTGGLSRRAQLIVVIIFGDLIRRLHKTTLLLPPPPRRSLCVHRLHFSAAPYVTS
jgi:hypothetical protein